MAGAQWYAVWQQKRDRLDRAVLYWRNLFLQFACQKYVYRLKTVKFRTTVFAMRVVTHCTSKSTTQPTIFWLSIITFHIKARVLQRENQVLKLWLLHFLKTNIIRFWKGQVSSLFCPFDINVFWSCAKGLEMEMCSGLVVWVCSGLAIEMFVPVPRKM